MCGKRIVECSRCDSFARAKVWLDTFSKDCPSQVDVNHLVKLVDIMKSFVEDDMIQLDCVQDNAIMCDGCTIECPSCNSFGWLRYGWIPFQRL